VQAVHEAAYRRLAAGYRGDPEGYALDILREHVSNQQRQIFRAVAKPGSKVLVRSAHKVGKTRGGAAIVNYMHDTFDPGLVIATAPSDQSLRRQLFKEIRTVRPFGLGLLPQANEIRHHEEHMVLGVLSKHPDSFQGKHGLSVYVLGDEFTAIPSTIVDRIGGMLKQSEGFGCLGLYNPYDPTTPPYLLEQSGEWDVIHLSALEHDNIAAGLRDEPPPVPAAVELGDMVQRIFKECEFCGDTPADDTCFLWPPESIREQVPDDAGDLPWGWYKPMTIDFEVQVLGRWPSSAFDAVWTEADWKRCLGSPSLEPDWPVQIGCDVARGGHDAVTFAVRKGIALVQLEKFSVRGVPRPSPKIADRARALAKEWAPPGVSPREVPVVIDDTGGYGSGVVDYPDGFNFIGLVSSEKAQDEKKYPNKRSELWWSLKVASETECFHVGTVRHGRELVDELQMDLKAARYTLDRKNRRVVEGKDAIKYRLKRSPDVADSVCLAWYPIAV